MFTYLRFPTLSKNAIAFVTEDDLWSVPRTGGQARRLTNMAGIVSHPAYSPDGSLIAFSSTHEGMEQVYVMPAEGGGLKRITYEGHPCYVVGFDPSGKRVLFRSAKEAAIRSQTYIYSVDLNGEHLDRLPVGQAYYVSCHPSGGEVAIGRHQLDSARWKRYRGGLAGDLWVGKLKEQKFRRLLSLEGNLTLPTWVGDRVFFISDHEGIGRIYSSNREGKDLQRHSTNKEFYARWMKAEGNTLVYQMGAEIHILNTENNKSEKVEIATASIRSDTYQKFVSPTEYLEEYVLHPKGHTMAYVIRGKLFVMPHWGGAALQLGQTEGVRYRLPRWVAGGEKIAVVSDESGAEGIELWNLKERRRERRISLSAIPRVIEIQPNPTREMLAFSDAAMNLHLLGLASETFKPIAKADHGKITEITWSPDGRWIAFVKPLFWLYSGGLLSLYDTEEGKEYPLTDEEVTGHSPAFDPEGKYLYMLSERTFNPVLDKIQFLASCPQATRPYLFVLDKTMRSPFVPKIEEEDLPEDANETKSAEEKEKKVICKIDIEGLCDRLVEFPEIPVGEYAMLKAMKHQVMLLDYPIAGLLDHSFGESYPDDLKPSLILYDLKKTKVTTIAHHIDEYQLAGEKVAWREKEKLRVFKAGEKPAEEEETHSGFTPQSGWVDMNRIRVAIHPIHEWRQMFLEGWRLQRDHFWTHDMAGVPWEKMRERYLPLVEKVSTRAELSDLIWELQGELGTSHAYEAGGEYPRTACYDVGLLGADLKLCNGKYVFEKIYKGDMWAPGKHSPLAESGVNIQRGDILLAINGHALSPGSIPSSLLVHQTGNDVTLTILQAGEKEPRDVSIRTLKSDRYVRYREWVNGNRKFVLEKSGGKLGYIHLPDMMGEGLSEFFRAFSAEAKLPGLIVDARDNGGGFVSQLVIEQLKREVIGFDRPRYGTYETYPLAAVRGPIVALCNEYAGSDGDIFCHAFKAYRMGKLIGKRTWGGVIGIDVSNFLVDGGLVTQPEYASWFYGDGWNIENRGVDPDIEVESDPASQVGGKDPQLEKAIQVALEALEKKPVLDPVFDAPPRRAAQILE